MMKSLISTLKKPQLAFLKIKQKLRKTFLYLLMLTLILTIPTFILSFVNKEALFYSKDNLNEVTRQIVDQDLYIEDGILKNPNNFKYANYANEVIIKVGDAAVGIPGYLVSLEESKITVGMTLGVGVDIVIAERSYSDFGYDNLSLDINNLYKLNYLITETITSSNTFVIYFVVQSFLTHFIDILIITLLLTVFAHFATRLPIKFKEHFNINAYVVSSYVIVELILTLFGLFYLNIISIIIAYIYQRIAYRSIRIVSKIKVEKKDE